MLNESYFDILYDINDKNDKWVKVMEDSGYKGLLDKLQLIDSKIDMLSSVDKSIKKETRSTNINEIAAALAKAQSAMCVAGLSKENPFFKSRYADLAEICRVSRPHLTANGLAVAQCVNENEEGMWLETLLLHTSGQFLSSNAKIKPIKNDIQSFGSYLTYLKRYCLASLIGVVSGDEDDDGEEAVSATRDTNVRFYRENQLNKQKEPPLEKITKEQVEQIEYELDGENDLAREFLKAYDIHNVADLPKKDFYVVIKIIRAKKQLKESIYKKD